MDDEVSEAAGNRRGAVDKGRDVLFYYSLGV